MVLELKLRKVGNSVGVVLPKEALTRLKVGAGDSLTLTEAVDGSLRVTPANEGREKFDDLSLQPLPRSRWNHTTSSSHSPVSPKSEGFTVTGSAKNNGFFESLLISTSPDL